MKRLRLIPIIIAVAMAGASMMSSCNDDLTTIGSSLSNGEVIITMDSLKTAIPAAVRMVPEIDGRGYTKLLGRISVPEYGSLGCSFVAQMVCSNKMTIPDSIPRESVDSVKLIMKVLRGSLTGDSLAPQQLTVYPLQKELPSSFNSDFDPSGYYNPESPWGKQSYTLSVIAAGDSAVKKVNYVSIPVKLPLEWGLKVFDMYRAGDPVFEWPQTFNAFFPGIYVEPSFGNGCIGNITTTEIYTYWHHTVTQSVLEDGVYVNRPVVKRDSVCLMSSQPIVNTTNLISYNISDQIKSLVEQGESIITTPGGYVVDFTFPVRTLLDRYLQAGEGMSVVSALEFSVPARTIRNDHGLDVAPWLLMVKRKDVDEFFASNKVPDNVESFYAAYDTETGSYRFSSMRQYFLNLYNAYRNGEEIKAEDTEFSFIPVNITTESVEGYNSVSTYVTRCAPYMIKPTMTRLSTDEALICFTFSNQALD